MDEEEEMNIDEDINYEEDYEINDIVKKDSNLNLDYEIVEPDKIMKNRESLIEQFIECSCLNYDEAELVLNHFEWNYDKLIDAWYDNMEEIKIDSHIEQSPESIVEITEYFQTNQIYENSCIICGDVRKDEDFIYLKCEHKTCKSCMSTYLFDILFSEQKNVLSTPCPLKGCNLYITKSIYKECIKDEIMLEIYEENIKNIFINKNKNIKKCPNKKCHYLIKSPDKLAKEIKCKCGQIFCFSCLEEYHSPCFCDMIKQWKLMENEIKISNDCPKVKIEAKCPICNALHKKTKIGNHIKCDCKEEFCFNCENKWDNNHINNCYENEIGKNKFYKYYKIVINIDNDFSFMKILNEDINNYISELSKKDLLDSDLQFLNEILDLIKDYYKFYKYLSIFRYFLISDVDDNFLDYNFSFLNNQINESLELLEFDSMPNLLKIPDAINFKHQFLEFKEKLLYLIKSIKIYKNNIIQEIEKNIFGKIDYKLLEAPIDSVTWSNVITSLKPEQFIIDIIKSNDFSFYSQKGKGNFSYFKFSSSTLSNDDEFIMKAYSQGYAFIMTKYLRTKEIDSCAYYGKFNEKEIKSSICCLQHSLFRNNNVTNGQVVYRAIKIFRFPTNIKEKSKFYFREFLSTSTNRNFSFNWLCGKGTFLIITITNNGTNGHKNYCYYIEDITVCKNQYEVVFACHCSFILDKIERTKNIDYVYLTCEGYLLD